MAPGGSNIGVWRTQALHTVPNPFPVYYREGFVAHRHEKGLLEKQHLQDCRALSQACC